MPRPVPITALLLTTLAAACGKQAAWGDANSIIVSTSPGVWESVGDTIRAVLEPRIFTVRDELMFKLTYQEPTEEYWTDLRRFKQLLLVGSPGDPWMEEAVAEVDRLPELPAVTQVRDVWARDQLVTLLLVAPGSEAEGVARLLPGLGSMFERQYRDWATRRMFLSGRDSALADTLRREAGFSLLVPRVYDWRTRDSIYVFRNDNPDPSELIRQIAVTWRTPAGDSLSHDALLGWRRSVAESHYSYPQVIDTTRVLTEPMTYRGREALQVQAVWNNPPEAGWPAGGPFILRGVRCPDQDRLYLLDAWLYAPAKEKYEYMIQLQTILDSFRCGGGEMMAGG